MSGLDADVVVVGAGIVGLATARAVQRRAPGRRVLVLDQEQRIAAHQTGRNSGVVHSGIYYQPGSAKARLVAEGRGELLELCRDHGVAHEVCGKVVVATHDGELPGLARLEARGAANGVATRRLGPPELREVEPHVRAVGALHVPSTAIVDFEAVCRALVAELLDGGGDLQLGRRVRAAREAAGRVEVETDTGVLRAGAVVNCAGLWSDRLAAASGDPTGVRIVPFRGEYHELVPEARHLVRALVYPVPDPRFPFLGVHLTRGVDGGVHAGPNAVLALARDGYGWRRWDRAELRELVGEPGLRRLARRHWRTGAAEVVRSLWRPALVRALQRLVPELRAEHLVPAPAGVRAQALRPDGTLVDDFVVAGGGRAVHVVNAPSPAATAALAIGREVAGRLQLP